MSFCEALVADLSKLAILIAGLHQSPVKDYESLLFAVPRMAPRSPRMLWCACACGWACITPEGPLPQSPGMLPAFALCIGYRRGSTLLRSSRIPRHILPQA